jgi:hypothetical protein
MDGAAYMPAAQWAQLMRSMGLSSAQCREERYAAVIHLVTAARGVGLTCSQLGLA